MRLRSCSRPVGITCGFTLIEIVVSSSLMALILVSGYFCLNAAFAGQKLIEPRVEVLQNARVAMALLTADLRNACPLSRDSAFLGMHRMIGEVEADNLDFATHNYTPRHSREGDFCEESIFVDQDKESGQLSLWRRRNPIIAVDPMSGGKREEIAQGVRGLRFEYSDGFDWYDTWGDVSTGGKAQTSLREQPNLSGMPDAVRITLWLNANPKAKAAGGSETTTNEPPLVFQTVARLNLAHSNQQGPGGISGPSDGSGDTSQANAGGNPGGGNP